MQVSQPRNNGSSAYTGRPASVEQESNTGLFTRLMNDATVLLRNEIALARSELKESAGHAKTAATGIASGGAMLHAGILFLLLAAMFALAEVMALWLASLIVGAVVTLIGFAMLKSGQKKFENASFKLERTRDSLRKDTHAVRRPA